MVKEKRPSTVCLDPENPIAREYNDRDIFEQVTTPDVSPSLTYMVRTGMVGEAMAGSSLYEYPELGTDDEAHDHPDYQKLMSQDIVEQSEFVNILENLNQKADEDTDDSKPVPAPSREEKTNPNREEKPTE